MKLYIASDHRGSDYKEKIIKYFSEQLIIEELDISNSESDDYPDFAFKLGEKVINTSNSMGILLCGNGIGMSIAANKVKGIRAVRAVNEEDALLSRNHNSANVLCLGSNLQFDLIIKIIETFINASSSVEEKHIRRIKKIINYEESAYNGL